jgi:hypothetical protein
MKIIISPLKSREAKTSPISSRHQPSTLYISKYCIMVSLKITAAAAILLDLPIMTGAFSIQGNDGAVESSSRRSFLLSTVAAATFASTVMPSPSLAAADCFSDCLKVRSF